MPSGRKRIVYVDMDGTLVDFGSGVARVDPDFAAPYLARGHPDEIPGVYSLMDPMPGAVEAFRELAERFDAYILSTAAWHNPSAWTDKLEWVKRTWGGGDDAPAFKRLILSHHKDLNRGDFLIDDNAIHGAAEFQGEWIQYGSAAFPDWDAVLSYLRAQA